MLGLWLFQIQHAITENTLKRQNPVTQYTKITECG